MKPSWSLFWSLPLLSLSALSFVPSMTFAQARPATPPRPRPGATAPRPTTPVVSITPSTAPTPDPNTPTAAPTTEPQVLVDETPIDITAPVGPTANTQTTGQNPDSGNNGLQATSGREGQDEPDESDERDASTTPCPTPAATAPAANMIQALTPQDYIRRANVLMGVAGLGVSTPQGTSPDLVAGISAAFTFRMVFNHFLLDPSLGLSWVGTNAAVPVQIQPGLRLGYVGQVGPQLALGFRGGYALLAQPFGTNSGVIHAIDADLHLTYVAPRGMLLEPYVTFGVTIANPVWPIAMLGLRMGYWL